MQSKNKLKIKSQKLFEILNNTWPNAHCELEHYNSFQLLIAVVLSAQTTDKSVNKALHPLLQENKNFSPSDMINMGLENFYQIIKSIGLAPTKSKNCLKIAQILIDKFQGEIPLNRADLESLPGVGRKTANVVLNVVCKLPTMPVDTHVERVSKRIGLVPLNANTRLVEDKLLEIVPKEHDTIAHHLLIFHGRYHCQAKKPKCDSCPIEKLCEKNLD